MTTRRFARTTRSGNTSFTVDSTGVQPGDHLLLFITQDNPTNLLTAPGSAQGWEVLMVGTTAGTRRSTLLYRRATVAEPATYTITSAASGSTKTATLVAITDAADRADWVIGAVKLRASIAENDNTNVAPAITLPEAGTALIFSMEATSTADTVAPTMSPGTLWYWSAASDTANTVTDTNVVGYQDGSGVLGPWTVTYQNTQTANGLAIAIGIPTLVPVSPTVQVAYESPTGQVVGTLAVKLADGVHLPTKAYGVQAGSPSVAALKARTAPFYVAHRGGSVDWPECSLHAYTQSAVRGVQGLEVSLSRTSDGVWFGLHDQTLDRVAGVTGNINPNTLTWAQLQATYHLEGTPDQPFMRWEELAAAYGRTHVLFVDPKYQNTAGLRAEFLAMLAPYVGNVVVKYYASNTVLGNAAQAAGFDSWGYYYAADFDAGGIDFDATSTAWTMLGLEYTANQALWDRVLAKGKPVLGHICPTFVDAATAIGKGADGVMLSGVRSLAGY